MHGCRAGWSSRGRGTEDVCLRGGACAGMGELCGAQMRVGVRRARGWRAGHRHHPMLHRRGERVPRLLVSASAVAGCTLVLGRQRSEHAAQQGGRHHHRHDTSPSLLLFAAMSNRREVLCSQSTWTQTFARHSWAARGREPRREPLLSPLLAEAARAAEVAPTGALSLLSRALPPTGPCMPPTAAGGVAFVSAADASAREPATRSSSPSRPKNRVKKPPIMMGCDDGVWACVRCSRSRARSTRTRTAAPAANTSQTLRQLSVS